MKKTIKRIGWIDTAKGLGIMLVILGHTNFPDKWAIVIYSFHMPLFFFLSGYLFSVKKYNNFGMFLKNKARSLLIPYFLFSFLSFLYLPLISTITTNGINLMKSFIGIFYSIGIDNWMLHNIVLWFLTCLFIVEVIFYIVVKNISNFKLILFVLFIFSILGYIDSLYMPIRLPWSIDIAITATVFFGFGFISNKKGIVDKLLNSKVIIIFVLSLLIFTLFIKNMITDNYMIDMNYNKLNNYFDFYIPAICGIILIIILSSLIKSKFLNYFGENTLVILATHLPLINLVGVLLDTVGVSITNQGGIRTILVSFFVSLLSIPLIYFINRYTPFLLGKKIKS
ncbi:acyltransferase family protein [Sporosarcina sp. Marseille-Q4063]|uniref:acyltransferase family protein n=1 Tax=Sporosarcina sp. Marseille-Q4063 TaxID=2810514 RepID=UPI001BAF1A41|nr:acyltransferase family protein [Sporosarcina sp. Marseille-Q4063]QUW21259.1 acyltransferase family protein [Sporosarcina sp. Marseille-Q4063]